MILETRMIDLKDIIIGKCLIRSIEKIKEDEDLKELSKSIEEIGQLHPCLIRIIDGKTELIAGARRYVALSLNNSQKIEVKIVEATDLEALEYGLNENIHTKIIDQIQRDFQIYRLWKLGKKTGKYKQIKDIAKKLSMGEVTIKKIISAGEEKNKYKNRETFQKATSLEMDKTRSLSKNPEIREKVLGLEITAKDKKTIAEKAKESIDKGLDEKVVIKVIDSASPITKDDNNDGNKDGQKIGILIQPEKIINDLDVLESSPKDVQKMYKEGKVNVADIKDINKFESSEARAQVLKEIKTIEKQKESSQKAYDWDRKTNLETRLKQQDEVKNNGNSTIKTRFDVQHERKLELERTKEQRHDEAYIERYRKLSMETLNVFSIFHPRKMKKEENKKVVVDVVKGLYSLYRQLLKEVGEIQGEIKEIKDIKIKDVNNEDISVIKEFSFI